jgi:hypothetical protein
MKRSNKFDWKIGLLAALMTAMIFSMRHLSESKAPTEEAKKVISTKR